MNYFGQWSNLQLVRQDGTMRLAADVLRDVPYVVLLFGASWSAETEQFLPLLENFYECYHTTKGFEVVYVSRDYNKTEMMRGFLSHERETTATARQQRRAHKEERHRLPLPPPLLASSASRESRQSSAEEVGRSDGERSSTPAPAAAMPSDTSSPPPLKRVAELAPAKSTHSFSGSAPSRSTTSDLLKPLTARGSRDYSGGIWAVPYDSVGVVGVPILYHLRVFTYPGVVVCRNKPLHPSVVPLLLPELQKASRWTEEAETRREKEETPEDVAAAAAPVDSGNAPQRRQTTPMVARRECEPEVVTIAGRFMMETEDPTGENFPWAHMGSQVRFAALFFFTIVVAIVAVVLSVMLPAVATMKQAKRAAAAAKAA